MAISDANDNLVAETRGDIVQQDWVENKDPITVSLDAGRQVQQTTQPTAIKQRLLGQVITSSPVVGQAGQVFNDSPTLITGLAPRTNGHIWAHQLNNATYTTRIFTLQSTPPGFTLMAQPEASLYIGSISAANQWPDIGSPFGPPNTALYMTSDWGNTDNVSATVKFTVVNVSGSSFNALVLWRWRVIQNSTGQASPLTFTTTTIQL